MAEVKLVLGAWRCYREVEWDTWYIETTYDLPPQVIPLTGFRMGLFWVEIEAVEYDMETHQTTIFLKDDDDMETHALKVMLHGWKLGLGQYLLEDEFERDRQVWDRVYPDWRSLLETDQHLTG